MVKHGEFKRLKYLDRFRAWCRETAGYELCELPPGESATLCILNAAVGQQNTSGEALDQGKGKDNCILLGGKTLCSVIGRELEGSFKLFPIRHRPFLLLQFFSLQFCESARTRVESQRDRRLYAVNVPDDAIQFLRLEDSFLGRSTLPPGLTLLENFLSAETEASILRELAAAPYPSFWETLNDRMVQHHGFAVRYSNKLDTSSFFQLEDGRAELPTFCDSLLSNFYRQFPLKFKFDQLTINYYEPGQGIAPHVDSEEAFDEPLLIVSLSSTAVLEFKELDAVEAKVSRVVLPPRSMLLLMGDARYRYTHAIRPVKVDYVNGQMLYRTQRLSLTFRVMKR